MLSSAFDSGTTQLILVGLLLMVASFYAGTLFGSTSPSSFDVPDHDAAPPTAPFPGDSRFKNRVALTYRGASVSMLERGVAVCPLRYNEHIPCHDMSYVEGIIERFDTSREEELESHCPPLEKRLFCLVPPPDGYRLPLKWPTSRDYVWHDNVNHTHLAEVKGGQNWVHEKGDLWWFPGGGTHFKHGASEYIQRLGNMITGGKGDLLSAGVVQVLDVGCGVASFAAYLLPLDIQTMSFAPKDGHENQIQFALERGIGAMIAVLATKQLPYPSHSFEMVHCSRCRVDWHENDGVLLKEVDRVLRANGFFVYSAPPAYKKDKNYPDIWEKVMNLTTNMCWKLIARQVQTAIWVKQEDNICRQQNAEKSLLTICIPEKDDGPSWKTPLGNCVYLVKKENSSKLPRAKRLLTYPQSLRNTSIDPDMFDSNMEYWEGQIYQYWKLMGINVTDVRNIMDMNALYGGFAVALRTNPVWVMNVVPPTMNDTLPAIYDRGLIGTYHDWCDAFSTYPRTYDLLHASHIFSHYQSLGEGCQMEDIMLEMDRIIRPEGFLIIRDGDIIVARINDLAPKFLWDCKSFALLNETREEEPVLICRKKFWAIVQGGE